MYILFVRLDGIWIERFRHAQERLVENARDEHMCVKGDNDGPDTFAWDDMKIEHE
jgi:hypothetical protein